MPAFMFSARAEVVIMKYTHKLALYLFGSHDQAFCLTVCFRFRTIIYIYSCSFHKAERMYTQTGTLFPCQVKP